MKKYASIHLSVNFIVILIISILIIGFGFVLVNNLVFISKENVNRMNERFEIELKNSLMRENKLISIPFVEKEFRRGNGDFFAIGVMNLETYVQNFKIDIRFDKAYERFSGDIIEIDALDWVRYIETNNIKINPLEQFVFEIAFFVPKDAKSGTYVYDISITNSEENPINDCFDNHLNCYDNSIHKLYLIVN